MARTYHSCARPLSTKFGTNHQSLGFGGVGVVVFLNITFDKTIAFLIMFIAGTGRQLSDAMLPRSIDVLVYECVYDKVVIIKAF